MSELGKIVFYLCLAIPVITFLFCLIMGNKIGGAFDRGDYKIWIKEVISSTIYLSLLLYTLLNFGINITNDKKLNYFNN